MDDMRRDQLRQNGALMAILLTDRTRSTEKQIRNIYWGTDSYRGRKTDAEIRLEDVALIQPRIMKSKDEQKNRTQSKAEVFTPREIVEKMNLTLDWQSDCWPTSPENWQDYVRATKLEITCGEAPFIVSRYNALSGKKILTLDSRVGFLDRKMQVVNEYCDDVESWLAWAKMAYRASYGYEWQGDNLLLARENLLLSFVDYYEAKLPAQKVPKSFLQEIAEIISWNIFQMDGMTYTVPMRKRYAKIMDWESNKIIEFRKIAK